MSSDRPKTPHGRAARRRQLILEWMFPIGGTFVLLIAFLVALFAR
jgi:hypothetical protein